MRRAHGLEITAALLSLGYTAMVLPLWAWGAELSNDYHERSRIAAWREGFVIVGTVIAIALPFTIGWKDAAAFHGLALIAVFVAVALPLCTALTLWAVPEPATTTRSRMSVAAALTAMRQNRHFTRLLSAFLINSLANALPATLFLLFVGQRLGAEDWRGPLLVTYFLSAIAGMPLWNLVSKRNSKHRAWCIAMLASCAVFMPAALLGQGDVAAFAVICVASGLVPRRGSGAAVIDAGRRDRIRPDRLGHQPLGVLLRGLVADLEAGAGAGRRHCLSAAAGFRPRRGRSVQEFGPQPRHAGAALRRGAGRA